MPLAAGRRALAPLLGNGRRREIVRVQILGPRIVGRPRPFEVGGNPLAHFGLYRFQLSFPDALLQQQVA